MVLNEDLNSVIKKLRIITGIVLFLYVFTHLLNLSVNIISIQAADFIRENYFHLIWKHSISKIVLYVSIIIHILLGVYAILSRKSFKISFREWVQISFPILALLVLLIHIPSGFVLSQIVHSDESYAMVLAAVFGSQKAIISFPTYSLMTVFIWAHGVIGIHGLLKFKSKFYKDYLFVFKFVYWCIPIFAILGFLAGLKEMSFLSYTHSLQNDSNYLWEVVWAKVPAEAYPIFDKIIKFATNYYPFIVLSIIAIVIFNIVKARYFGKITITYPGDIKFNVPEGTTILEASRLAGIRHVSACGGRGRCTTCRVKILSDTSDAPIPNVHESKVIERLGFDKDIRLACQLKPTKNITVLPLLNYQTNAGEFKTPVSLSGKEKETVIVFIDLRGFTKLAETKLPYDIVYILNKYYSVCGEIIERHRGRLDKFIGDGIMAIFDGANDLNINCENSLKAASEISNDINEINDQMKSDFNEELKLGIGIHVGNTIVGMMGYGSTVSETAVGDNVNIASKLEGLSKTYKCQLVVSKSVAEKAKLNLKQFKSDVVKISGRKEDLEILMLNNASNISFFQK